VSVASAAPAAREVRARPLWRTVAIPSEHGGWGLTLEPVLLGLLVAFSPAGVAIGLATFLAFLVRTPLKLALVDRRRGRTLPRTKLAWLIVLAELTLLAGAVSVALAAAGWTWLIPFAVAAPLFSVELWFEVRSRGRRLVPELSGAVGITAASAAIVVAAGEPAGLAVAIWTVLAARALASIPYVRTQVLRLRHDMPLGATDAFQVAGAVIAVAASAIDHRIVVGGVAVVVLALLQMATLRRPIPPVKILGLRQMAAGLAVVAATAAGVFALP
jgi:YwiC-like protein